MTHTPQPLAALLRPRGSCLSQHQRMQRIRTIGAHRLRPQWHEQNDYQSH